MDQPYTVISTIKQQLFLVEEDSSLSTTVARQLRQLAFKYQDESGGLNFDSRKLRRGENKAFRNQASSTP